MKKILSHKYNEEYINLEEIKEFLSTKKQIKYSRDKSDYVMGILSPLLLVPTISLFDNEVLLKKYPEGVVTENFILIPVEKFLEVKKNAKKETSKVRKDKFISYEIYPLVNFLNKYMSRFLEIGLNIEFTEEENKRFDEIIKNNTYQKYNEDMTINPVQTTNRDLLKIIAGQNLTIEQVLLNPISLEQDIKEVLKENELILEGLSSLQQKINDVSITEVNANMSLEEFIKLVKKSENFEISPVLTLKIVNKISQDLFKQCNEDVGEFNEKAKEKLFPFMSKLLPLQFKMSIEYISGNILQIEKNGYQVAEKFSMNMVKSVDLNDIQRNNMISVITEYDKITGSINFSGSNPYTMNKFEVKKEFLDFFNYSKDKDKRKEEKSTDMLKVFSLNSLDNSIDLQEFTTIANQIKYEGASPISALKIIKQKIDDLIQVSQGEFKEFNSEAKNKVYPFMEKLMPEEFKATLEYVVTNVVNKKAEKNINEFVNTIYQYTSNPEQRKVIVTIIQDYAPETSENALNQVEKGHVRRKII